jgi:hypothetical protein
MRRLPTGRISLGAFSIAVLAIAGPVVAAGESFDGFYVGRRTLTKGPDQCPTNQSVSLIIHGDVLTFTNSVLENFAIAVDIHPDGTFSDIYVDVGGDVTEIHLRIVGSVLDADVTNPPCQHHWRLEKK